MAEITPETPKPMLDMDATCHLLMGAYRKWVRDGRPMRERGAVRDEAATPKVSGREPALRGA